MKVNLIQIFIKRIILIFFAGIFLWSCSSIDEEVAEILSRPDESEPVPTTPMWTKIFEDGNLMYQVTVMAFADEHQVSILVAKDGEGESSTSLPSYPLLRYAFVDLTESGRKDLIFIGHQFKQPSFESFYGFTRVNDFIATLQLPSLPFKLIQGFNGKETISIKPPYVEKRMKFNTGEGKEYEKVIILKFSQDGVGRIYAVDGKLYNAEDYLEEEEKATESNSEEDNVEEEVNEQTESASEEENKNDI
jgi:hypothetical protein